MLRIAGPGGIKPSRGVGTLRADGVGEVSRRAQRSPGADVRREGPNLMGGATEILAADRSTSDHREVDGAKRLC